MKTENTWGNWSHIPTNAPGSRPSTVRRDIVADSEFGPAFIAGDILPDHANLISAAPDLLNALEYVLSIITAPDCPQIPDAAFTRGKIVNAIRKAKGGE